MTEDEKIKWSECPHCHKLTPDYLRTCFKCGKVRVAPVEPKPVPPAPTPEPKKPTGWWNCKRCGARDNPPLGESCLKCHAVRPGYEKEKPKPTPPKDDSGGTPQPPASKSWLKTVLAWGTVLATGLGIASFFYPPLAPIATLIKAVIAALSGLQF